MLDKDQENREPTDVETALVFDLDGTLIRTDMLAESLSAMLATEPLAAFQIPWWLARGKANLKARIADRSVVDPRILPFVDESIRFLLAEKARGRRVYLASASDDRQVQAVSDHLGVFDGVFGSNGEVNLRGAAKAAVLCREFGAKRFDYVGDSSADLPVWEQARKAIAANCDAPTLKALRKRHGDVTCLVQRRFRVGDYLRAIRVHQWVKNGLLFLPMLAAHLLNLGSVIELVLAFFAFSFVASAVYLLNDLFDLRADRDHATKRLRPLASGDMPLLHGVVMVPVLMLAGGLLGSAVNLPFLGILGFYFAVTLAYSMVLKRVPVVDIMTLAGLYTLRMIAGGAALQISLSAWLLAFSMFFFLSLALVKRLAELKARLDAGKGDPSGRGYFLADIPLLEALAGAAGYAAVVVLALYVNSPAVVALYDRPQGLWLVCALLLYWISRILLITHRGAMHDDPVVFALKDRMSLAVVTLVTVIVVVSTF